MSNAEKYLVPALPWAILGSDVGASHKESLAFEKTRSMGRSRRLYRKPALVGKNGSQNLGLLGGAAMLGLTMGDRREHLELLELWGNYAKLPWMAKEPGSRIYLSWILMPCIVAYCFARRAGERATAEAIRKHVRTTIIMLTLGASWESSGLSKGNRYAGFPITLCGARSLVSGKNDGTRIGVDGRGNEPRYTYSHPASEVLSGLLFGEPLKTERHRLTWEGSVMRACHRATGVNPYELLFSWERETLLTLITAASPWGECPAEMMSAKLWLEEGPLPLVPFQLIRSTEGTATICERGINTGSTSAMYAYVWRRRLNGSPDGGKWLQHYGWWNERPGVEFFHLDDFSKRGEGKAGEAELVWNEECGKFLVCGLRSRTLDFFDDATQSFRKGWKTNVLFGGDVIWHFRVSPQGVLGPYPPPREPYRR